MQLQKLLPRPLDKEGGSECATLMNAMMALTHLDRSLARRLGWRGLRPSFAGGFCWSARIASFEPLFGIAFEGETFDQGVLSAHFALYVFPRPGSPVLKAYPEAVRAKIEAPDCRQRVRELSLNRGYFAPFLAAGLDMVVSPAGDALALTVTAERRLAFGFRDGAAGAPLEPMRMVLPLFSAIAGGFEASVDEKPEYVLTAERAPGLLMNDEGAVFGNTLASDPGVLVLGISAAFGTFKGRLPGRRMRRLPFAYRPNEAASTTRPALHILTGFLGSGKTTILQAWLEHLNGRERFTGVLQNEFGRTDLDTVLLSGTTRVEALDEGCVCCTIADALRPGILRLLSTTPADELILETTGLARPSLLMDEVRLLGDIVEPGLVITAVDALGFTSEPGLFENREAGEESACRVDQIESADVLIVTKADRVREEAVEALEQKLHAMNPQALLLTADRGSIPFGLIDAFFLATIDEDRERSMPSRTVRPGSAPDFFQFGKTLRGARPMAAKPWRANPALAGGIANVTTEALRWEASPAFERVKEEIAAVVGGGTLLRAKGFVRLALPQKEAWALVEWSAGKYGVTWSNPPVPLAGAGFVTVIWRRAAS